MACRHTSATRTGDGTVKRSILTVAILAALAGCGDRFKSHQEELAYLTALSNPTPDQWKRREELRVDFRAAEQVVREYLASATEDEEQGRTKDAISDVGIAVYTAKDYPDAEFARAARAAFDRLKPLMDD